MQLMARYWLEADNSYVHLNSTFERLTRFVHDRGFEASQTTLKNVAAQNENKGDPDA